MRRVVLESPYAAPNVPEWARPAEIADNVAYAKRCMLDCLRRGDGPIASHLLWTQDGILDDDVPADRAAGIEAGLIWGEVAEAAVFYVDRGASRGMLAAAAHYAQRGVKMEWRSLENGPMFAPRAMLAIRDLQRASKFNLADARQSEAERAWDDFWEALERSGAGRLAIAAVEKLAALVERFNAWLRGRA